MNRPRLKLAPHRIAGAVAVIRKTSLLVKPRRTVTVIDADEPDARLLECAEAAGADYLVTGNTRHFPKTFKNTIIFNPKQFVDLLLPRLAGLNRPQ